MGDRNSSVAKDGLTAVHVTDRSVHKIGAHRLWTMDLAEIWDYRALMLLLAWRSIRVRYKQTILGLLWALIAPVAFTAMFVLFFSLLPVRPVRGFAICAGSFCGNDLVAIFQPRCDRGRRKSDCERKSDHKDLFPACDLATGGRRIVPCGTTDHADFADCPASFLRGADRRTNPMGATVHSARVRFGGRIWAYGYLQSTGSSVTCDMPCPCFSSWACLSARLPTR